MTAHENQQAAEQLFAAFERWDLETVESLVADDAVEGRPQSGERFVGRTNIMGMLRSLPSQPEIAWRSIRGGPSLWAAEGIVEYGEGPVHLIGIVELDGREGGQERLLLRLRLRAAPVPRPVRGAAGVVAQAVPSSSSS